MKLSLGITGIMLLAAASLSLAAPIPATFSRLSHAPLARAETDANVRDQDSLLRFATVHEELDSRTEARQSSDNERLQLLPRGPVTLDLLDKILDTSGHVTQGNELPRLASDRASGSNDVSTELHLQTGGRDAPLHFNPPQGQQGSNADLTLTISGSRPGRERLMGGARWRGQQTADTASAAGTRGQPLAPYWHADQLPGKSKERVASLDRQDSSSIKTGMNNRRTSSALPRHGAASSTIPSTPSPLQPSAVTASRARASLEHLSAQQQTPAVVTNTDRNSHHVAAVAEAMRSSPPQTSRSLHAGKGTAETSGIKSFLAEFAQEQADLFQVYLDETKFGRLVKRPPKLIEAEEYIVSKYKELEADNPEAEAALVRSLQTAKVSSTLTSAGIVKPVDMPPEAWDQAIDVIYRRNRLHRQFGTYGPQLEALRKKRLEATQAANGIQTGTSGKGSSSLVRSDSTAGAQVTAVGGALKRGLVSGTDSSPAEKRARSTIAFDEFVQRQQDLFDLSYKSRSTVRRMDYKPILEAEAYILSQYAKLKPKDAAHAEELIKTLQSAKRSDRLAQAGIVMPPNMFDETVWEKAVEIMYKRYKTHIATDSFAPQLRALKAQRDALERERHS